MLRAQALATVLNVQRTPAVSTTAVLLNGPERSALGGAGSCLTVTGALQAAQANYGTITATKSTVVLVKNLFDRINNNRQLTC
jgi:hypothetical protein